MLLGKVIDINIKFGFISSMYCNTSSLGVDGEILKTLKPFLN